MEIGELKEDIEKQIENYQLSKDVIMIDSVSNPEEYLQAMDIFVLPSLYEGLPFVAVEAQVSGLMVVTSDTVSNEIPIDSLKRYYSLNSPANKWAKKIITLSNNKRENRADDIQKKGFDIKTQAKKLEEYYKSEVKKRL